MVAIKIKSGPFCEIYAIEQNGKCPLFDFLLALRGSARRDFDRLVRLLDWMTDVGRIINEEKFKRLTPDIHEFKTHGGVRVLCFFDGRCMIILTNGFKKKKRYVDEITKAENLRLTYLSAKNNNCLSYREEIL